MKKKRQKGEKQPIEHQNVVTQPTNKAEKQYRQKSANEFVDNEQEPKFENMTKMDKIWVATASLIYPEVNCKKYVSGSQITSRVARMFNTEISPAMMNSHLVSSVDRMADKKNPVRGGSRNRYLFKTNDGIKPYTKGNFRLYKSKDEKYDGWEKTGKINPDKEDVNKEYHYLIEWYVNSYFNSN